MLFKKYVFIVKETELKTCDNFENWHATREYEYACSNLKKAKKLYLERAMALRNNYDTGAFHEDATEYIQGPMELRGDKFDVVYKTNDGDTINVSLRISRLEVQ